jgi:hypothetical protein
MGMAVTLLCFLTTRVEFASLGVSGNLDPSDAAKSSFSLHSSWKNYPNHSISFTSQ